MSSLMLVAGSSGSSRIRHVSIGSILLVSGLAACGLLAAGAGLGYWVSATSPPKLGETERPRSARPFTMEQIGALSGRLFKLENQAGQLSERIGAMPGESPRRGPSARAAKPGSGGPLLPPRPAQDSLEDLGAIESRVANVERQLALVSDAETRQNLALLRLPSRLPVDGAELVSLFGNREDPLTGRRAFHAGLDFAAVQGTVIHAAAGGTVAFAGFRHDFGWVVEIEHGDGLMTRYAHASRLLVAAGSLVMPGDPIAEVGSTGRSTGPHLHFEVLRNGEATDPRQYLARL